MKDIVATYKNELRNLVSLQKQVDDLNGRIEDIWYILTGVRGIDPSRTRVSSNPSVSEEKRLEMEDQIEHLTREKERIESNISYIRQILQLMPRDIRDACILIYAKGEKYSKVAMMQYRSTGSLQRAINSSIEQALNRYRYR